MSERITEAELATVERNAGAGVNPLWLVAEVRRLRGIIYAEAEVVMGTIRLSRIVPITTAFLAEADAIRREQGK